MNSYLKCTPVSKSKIREYASKIRKVYEVNGVYFPIYQIIESLVDDGDLSYEVVSEDDERLLKDERAKYILNSNEILIKESDYIEVLNEVGRARFTLTHEFSHYFLLKVLGYRCEIAEERPKAYEDPEWQANTLAAELLCPLDLTKDFSVDELIKKCKISEESALIHYKLRKAGKKKCANIKLD